MISATTRLVALIGHPVADSLSPQMHNAAFAARGLDGAYVALDVEPARLEDAVRGLAAAGFAGANVTTPYKLEVAKLVETDEPSVNTLVFEADRVRGYSTDAAAIAGIRAERPAVLGDGGAAVAFARALPHARVFSRKGRWPPDERHADVIVNATSARDELPVALDAGQTLVDVPYPETPTAVAARERGARVIDGVEVLVAQGAASFELWTGIPAPLEVMRAAVRA